MIFLDFVAFAILWWFAAATLAASDHVTDWQSTVATLALIVICACSFVGMVGTLKSVEMIAHWWTRGIVHAAAIIAVCVYDLRFGVARHVRMARKGIAGYFAEPCA